MNINKASKVAMWSLAYLFVVRLLGTLARGIFMNPIISGINIFLSMLASLGIVVFYIYFFKQYAVNKQTVVRITTKFAIVGASLIVLLYINNALKYLNTGLIIPSGLEVSIPAINALILLVFFVSVAVKMELFKRPSQLAAFGAILALILRVPIIINYFSGGGFWFSGLEKKLQILFLPVIAVNFVCILLFYNAVFKQSLVNKREKNA